jgi:hypothetical protein
VVELVQRGEANDRPEVMGGLFNMCFKYFVFLPSAIVQSDCFVNLFELASMSILSSEKESTRHVLQFIGEVLRKTNPNPM